MKKPNVKINFLYNLIYQILLIIHPLILSPYIARVLNPSLIGTYSYNNSIASYFVLFAMLGLSNYGNRTISQIKDNKSELTKTFWSIYAFQFVCAIVVLIAYLVYCFIGHGNQRTVTLLFGLYVISAVFDISWFFFGMEQFGITVTRTFVIRILTIVLIFVFVHSEQDFFLYILIMAGSHLGSALILWKYINKYVDFYKPTKKNVMEHIKPNLILFVPVLAISLYNVMDKIMVGAISGMEQAGYYENVEKVLKIPMSIITALGTAMLPRMSNMFVSSQKNKSEEYIRKSLLFANWVSCAGAFGLMSISGKFIPLFYGEQYLACISLLAAIAPTILFKAWANVIRTQYLIPRGMDRSYLISVCLGAVVNLICNFMLIPRMQSMGAVIGTVIAEAVVCISQTWAVRKELPVKSFLKENMAFLVFGFFMAICVYVAGNLLNVGLIVTVAIQVIVGAIVYCAMSFLYLKKMRV